jgi:hypothetical protein
MHWWDSADMMARVARRSAIAGGVCAVIATATSPLAWIVAVPAAVLCVTALLCAAFAWFRLDDLRGRAPRR